MSEVKQFSSTKEMIAYTRAQRRGQTEAFEVKEIAVPIGTPKKPAKPREKKVEKDE